MGYNNKICSSKTTTMNKIKYYTHLNIKIIHVFGYFGLIFVSKKCDLSKYKK